MKFDRIYRKTWRVLVLRLLFVFSPVAFLAAAHCADGHFSVGHDESTEDAVTLIDDPAEGILSLDGGLSVAETAEMLDVSVGSVERDWRLARTKLYAELRNTQTD